MVERVSEQSFQDEEGNLVELVGPCDTVRAQQAGVPPAVLDGFKDGIPPAWGMLLGIADSIYSATRKLPFPHLPHGASQPSSPQILPYSGALIDYSDDEALPESLFDFGTGYKRPEGAPRTARQLAEVWEGLSAAHMVEEDIIVREDRDAAYDEEAQDEEEEGEPLPEMEGRAEVASPSLVDGSLQEEQHSDMTPETARGIAPQTLATPAKMSSPEPVHLPSPKDSPPIVPPSLPPINDVAYTETSEALVMATSQPAVESDFIGEIPEPTSIEPELPFADRAGVVEPAGDVESEDVEAERAKICHLDAIVPAFPGHQRSTPPPASAFLGDTDVSPQFDPAPSSFSALYQESDVDSTDAFANDVVQFIADDAEGYGGHLRGRSGTAETASDVAVEDALLRGRVAPVDYEWLAAVEEEPRSSQAAQDLDEVVPESPRSSPPPELELQEAAPIAMEEGRAPNGFAVAIGSPPQQPVAQQAVQQEVPAQGLASPQEEEERIEEQPQASQVSVADIAALYRDETAEPRLADGGSSLALELEQAAEEPTVAVEDEQLLPAMAGPAGDLDLGREVEEVGEVEQLEESAGQATTREDEGSLRLEELPSHLHAPYATDTEHNSVNVDCSPSKEFSPALAALAEDAPIVTMPSPSKPSPRSKANLGAASFAVEIDASLRRLKSRIPPSPSSASRLASAKQQAGSLSPSPIASTSNALPPTPSRHLSFPSPRQPPVGSTPRHETPPPAAVASSSRARSTTASPRKAKLEPYVDVVVRRKPRRSSARAPSLAAADTYVAAIAEAPPIAGQVEDSHAPITREATPPPVLARVVSDRQEVAEEEEEDFVVSPAGKGRAMGSGKRQRAVVESEDEHLLQETASSVVEETVSERLDEQDDRVEEAPKASTSAGSSSYLAPLDVNSSPVKPATSGKRARPNKRPSRAARVVESDEEGGGDDLSEQRDASPSLETEQQRPQKRKKLARVPSGGVKGKGRATVESEERVEDSEVEVPDFQQPPEPQDDDDDLALGPPTMTSARKPSAHRHPSPSNSQPTPQRHTRPVAASSSIKSRSRGPAALSAARARASSSTSVQPATPSTTASSGRPQRARKSTEGWWKLDRALESLQSGKKRAKVENDDEQEEEEEEEERQPSARAARGRGGKKARVVEDSEEDGEGKSEQQGEEEDEDDVPVVKLKRKSSTTARKSKSKTTSTPSAATPSPKPKPARPHRDKPTDLSSINTGTNKGNGKAGGSLPRWAHGASWEGLGEVRVAKEAKEDGWQFSD